MHAKTYFFPGWNQFLYSRIEIGIIKIHSSVFNKIYEWIENLGDFESFVYITSFHAGVLTLKWNKSRVYYIDEEKLSVNLTPFKCELF